MDASAVQQSISVAQVAQDRPTMVLRIEAVGIEGRPPQAAALPLGKEP